MSEKCECWILYGNEGPQSDRIERCAHCLGLEKRVEELEACTCGHQTAMHDFNHTGHAGFEQSPCRAAGCQCRMFESRAERIALLEAELKQRDAQLLMVRATLEEFKFGPHEKEGLRLQISNLEARNAELEAELLKLKGTFK